MYVEEKKNDSAFASFSYSFATYPLLVRDRILWSDLTQHSS